jgi:hypothetical protein
MDWNEPSARKNSIEGLSMAEFKGVQQKAKSFVIDELVPWYYEKIRNTDLKSGKHMMFAMVASFAGSALCLTYAKMFGKPGAVNEAAAGLCGMAIVDLQATIDTMSENVNTKTKKLLQLKSVGDLGPTIYANSRTMTKEEVIQKMSFIVGQIYDMAKEVDGE